MDAQTHIANIRKAVETRIDTKFPEIPADVAASMGLAAMDMDELIVKRIQTMQAAKRIFNNWGDIRPWSIRQRDAFIGECLYDLIAIERHIEGRK
jgi:hypothetical protein